MLILLIGFTTLGAQNQFELQDLPVQKHHIIHPVLKSALIPGWGEVSNGSKSGFVFLASEAILWASRFYALDQKELSERKAYSYAIEYGHINPVNDYEEEYFDALKKYDNSGFEPGGYNYDIVQQATNLFPGDPNSQTEYVQLHAISDEFRWDWDSYEDRKYYAGRRTDILDYSDTVKAVSGVIIANHLISVINSARINAKSKRLRTEVTLDSKFNPGIQLSYRF